MGLAILGVLVLLYILLAYFAARTWQVWHVVMLVFLFMGTFLFCMLTAATLKVQKRWRENYRSTVENIEREEANHERLLRGSRLDQELGEHQLRGEAKRLTVDRGRVWRNLRIGEISEGQLLLDASAWTSSGCGLPGQANSADEGTDTDENGESAEDGGQDPSGTAPPVGLEVDSIVFAFKEIPLGALPESVQSSLGELSERENSAQCRVPWYYMGEYRVVGDPAANPLAITLVPAVPLRQAQIDRLEDENATWALYEVMPIDSREAFRGLTAEQIAELIPGADDRVIQAYVRDGQQAQEADPPESKWMRIRFTAPHTETVDVTVEAAAGQPLSDSWFDPSGRSLTASLNQGSNTEFSEGDEVVFDFETAQRLIADGKAEAIEPIYRRDLRDYALYFRGFHQTLESLGHQITVAEADVAKLNESIERLQTQMAFQEQQSEDLRFDIDGLAKERQVLSDYLSVLESTWNDLRAELSRLYRTNRSLVNSGN